MSPDRKVFSLGHSPDPDDAFMFYAIAENKIDLRGYRFEHRLEDIQTLNERALRGELHISAISIHAYAYVADKYSLLPCGASMGDGYGPILVRKIQNSKPQTPRPKRDVDLPVCAMGIGRLGAVSRVLFAQCGSAFVYTSLSEPRVEGQMALEEFRAALRAFGIRLKSARPMN